jgi:molybdate transport system substrate-binding protein
MITRLGEPRSVRRTGPGSRLRARHRDTGLVAGLCAATAVLVLTACSSSSGSTATSGGTESGGTESGGTASGGTGFGGTSAKPSGTLVVFAAASLNGAFDKIGAQFEKANPGVTVKFNYAGSSSLVTSIKQGAPVDVFASANTQNMTAVTDENLASGTPKVFARNQGEIMVEAGNPKQVTSVSDLADPAVKVVLCAPEVPCGSLAQQIFKKAGITVKPVSEETSVGGVVTKVSLGEADAGLVYVTDVKAGGDKVEGVPISTGQNVLADYPVAELKDAPNPTAASSFIDYVLSAPGQEVLASFGFMPPES